MSKTQTDPSTEVVPWEDDLPTSAKIKPTPELVKMYFDAIESTLPDDVFFEVGDPEITARAIRDRIRSGKTFEDVFAPQKLPRLSDLAGESFVVHGFHVQKSKYDKADSSRIYAIVQVLRPSGELELRHTGGTNVLTQLGVAWERDWFPFTTTIIVKDTGNEGRTTQWLQMPEAKAAV